MNPNGRIDDIILTRDGDADLISLRGISKAISILSMLPLLNCSFPTYSISPDMTELYSDSNDKTTCWLGTCLAGVWLEHVMSLFFSSIQARILNVSVLNLTLTSDLEGPSAYCNLMKTGNNKCLLIFARTNDEDEAHIEYSVQRLVVRVCTKVGRLDGCGPRSNGSSRTPHFQQ